MTESEKMGDLEMTRTEALRAELAHEGYPLLTANGEKWMPHDTAIAQIEKCFALLATLEHEAAWIPCASLLPEPGVPVLVVVSGRDDVQVAFREPEAPEHWTCNESNSGIPVPITHWKPQPRKANP